MDFEIEQLTVLKRHDITEAGCHGCGGGCSAPPVPMRTMPQEKYAVGPLRGSFINATGANAAAFVNELLTAR